METPKKILNAGCGRYPEKDKVNMDLVKMVGIDVVHNMDEFPYPFQDGEFDEIIARDVVEHLTDIVKVMEEFWRILKPGGRLWIRTNDARYPERAWEDPTHKHAFTIHSFDYWDKTTFYGKEFGFYTKAQFKVIERVEKNMGVEITLIKV